MRFALVILIWFSIVGGLWAYIQYRQLRSPAAILVAPASMTAAEHYALILTPTFSAEPDPFALQTVDSPAASIELRVNGTNLSLEGQQVERGAALLIDPLPGLVIGHNEVFVQTSPPTGEGSIDHAIRVQIVTNGASVVDQTLRSGQGSLVSGTVNLVLESEEEAHDH